MIFGYMSRDFYLKEHDPERWAVEKTWPPKEGFTHRAMPTDIQERCETIEACYEFTLSYAAQGLPTDEGSPSGKQLRDQLGARPRRCGKSMRAIERR